MGKRWSTILLLATFWGYGFPFLTASAFFRKVEKKPVIQIKLRDSNIVIEPAPVPPAAARFAFAKSQLAKGDKRKAISTFMKLANENPNGPLADDCVLMVMMYYLESANLSKAFETYEKLRTIYPNKSTFSIGKEKLLKYLHENPIECNLVEIVDQYNDYFVKDDSGSGDYSSQAKVNARAYIRSKSFSLDRKIIERLKDKLEHTVFSSKTVDIFAKVTGVSKTKIKPALVAHCRSRITVSDPVLSFVSYSKVKAERHLSHKYRHEIKFNIVLEGHCVVRLKDVFHMKFFKDGKEVQQDGKKIQQDGKRDVP